MKKIVDPDTPAVLSCSWLVTAVALKVMYLVTPLVIVTVAPATTNCKPGYESNIAFTATVYSSPTNVVKFFQVKLFVVLVVTLRSPPMAATTAGELAAHPSTVEVNRCGSSM